MPNYYQEYGEHPNTMNPPTHTKHMRHFETTRTILKKFLPILLYIMATILVVGSVLSLFRNAELRYLKMVDFPRILFFIVSVLTLLALIIARRQWSWHKWLLVVGLLVGIGIHSAFLINYTPLVAVEVPSVQQIKPTEASFSLLLSNVKMSNRHAQPLLQLIALKQPDVILAMEVDSWWDDQLKSLSKDYPYSQHTTNDVAYGMVLYSKLPMDTLEVHYLTHKNVPSFESILRLSNGKKISFHAIHPVPPTHFKDYPDNKGQKENALIKVGKKIKSRTLPTVVAGDLNDVIWYYVDGVTDTEHLLHDVRVGRGFYNSYNAKNRLMRWPLDHVFVTEEFKLKQLERLTSINSDHFPIYVELVL